MVSRFDIAKVLSVDISFSSGFNESIVSVMSTYMKSERCCGEKILSEVGQNAPFFSLKGILKEDGAQGLKEV